MAKAGNSSGKFRFKGFINVEFALEDRQTFGAWLKDVEPDLGDCITVLVEANYKLGFSFDDYHGVTQVSLTCKDEAVIYYGYCLTFKHADLSRGAMIMRWFYDTYLANEDYRLVEPSGKYDW